MTALRRFSFRVSRIKKIQCLLITPPLQIMPQHRMRIGTELLFKLEDSIQRCCDLFRSALRRCLDKLHQRIPQFVLNDRQCYFLTPLRCLPRCLPGLKSHSSQSSSATNLLSLRSQRFGRRLFRLARNGSSGRFGL